MAKTHREGGSAGPEPTSPGPAPAPSDCWVFDVDGCLVDSLTGTSLRPGARAVLDHLARGGRRIILWSAGGNEYARARAEQFGIDGLVSAYCSKDDRDGNGSFETGQLPLRGSSVVFVDDRPEDLGRDLDVLAVSPYLCDDRHDRGLEPVARRAGLG
jgi:long-chain acyl-CoA synthetase